MTMDLTRRRTAARPKRRSARDLLMRTLAAGCDKPADALEIYYWSKEPGLVEIIRAIAMMPEEARAAIEAFVALAHDQGTVRARLDPRGVLTLASVQAARSVALAQYAAANDIDDVPHSLN
jgi:hypothetical protein